MPLAPRHKVFVSYHHEKDQGRRNRFERLFADVNNNMDSRLVKRGDIPNGFNLDGISRRIRDDFLKDSTVTVVLVGKGTWTRKYVDCEIAATVRDTEANPGEFRAELETLQEELRNYNCLLAGLRASKI